MKKTKGFLCVICIILTFSFLITPANAQTEELLSASDNEATDNAIGCYSADAKDAFLGSAQIVKNAKSAFLYELNTKTLMYAWEPDLPLAPTSFAKILTAIIAIEEGAMDSAVTVTESALADLPPSAVSADLSVNEVLPLQELIYCMLVGSANDAASVIAHYLSGGQVPFALKMNEFAQKIGCTNSHFTNPHGLHDPAQVTTARDTAKILEYAMGNDLFRKIFAATEYTVPATNKSAERHLITGNYLMSMEEVEIYFDERVIGGRTGVANDNTRCLASVARVESMELLSVVMGSASIYEEGGNRIRSFGGYTETKSLLDAGFTGFAAKQILYDGQALVQFDVANGDALLTAAPRTSIRTVLPEQLETGDLSFRYSEDGRGLAAPIKAGDFICNVEVWYQGLRIAATELYALNDVRAQSLVQVQEPKSESIWPLILTVICVVIVAGVATLGLRSKWGRRIVLRLRRVMKRRFKGKWYDGLGIFARTL